MKRTSTDLSIRMCPIHDWWCTHRDGVCITEGDVPHFDPDEPTVSKARPFSHAGTTR